MESPHLLQTRQRLLQAAGEVFAEQGYRNTTVRQICDRAGANIAAVNYHFQGKEQLYGAVLRHAHSCALEQFPPTLDLPQEASPRQRLHAFVRAFLLRIFNEGQPSWLGKLMAREMVEPTAVLDELVQQSIRPQSHVLASIVVEMLGKSAGKELVQRCVCSVVGQCLFYHHARPVVQRLYPHQGYSKGEIEKLADHITAFSFAAITQMARSKSNHRRSAKS